MSQHRPGVDGALAAFLMLVAAATGAESRAPGPEPSGRLLSPAEVSTILSKTGPGSGPCDEWTLEQARKVWKPMARAVQHVGIPGCQWQTAVTWDGSLVFGPVAFRIAPEVAPLGNNLLHLSVGYGDPMRFIDRKGSNSPMVRKGLELGRLPIPVVESRDGDLAWTETVFAHLLERAPAEALQPRADDLLVTHACWKVRKTGFGPRKGNLWLHFGDTSKFHFGYKCGVEDGLGPSLPHTLAEGLGMMEGKVRYVIPQPARGQVRQEAEVQPLGMKVQAKNVIHWAVDLEPGEEAEFRLVVPYGLVEKSVGRQLASLPSDRLLDDVRRFWKETLADAGQIATPDPFVNDYLAAVAGQMAQQIAYRRHPGVWMLKTSPNHYENYWPCNAAKALPALDFRGLTELNARVLSGFVAMQTDDVRGLDRQEMGHGKPLSGEGFGKRHGFLGNFRQWTANPLLLSHGLGMWALAAHYRVTRDDGWLGRGPGSPLQAMLDAFDWVSYQRRRTMREEDGKKIPHWGLLPAASAHDWLAGNTVFNDAFCAMGMAEVVRLLRETRHPRAEEMAKELHDYRECIRAAYKAARDRARPLPLPGGKNLAYVPRVAQELDWSRIDWTYTILGPLSASAWGGVLEPRDELVDESLAFLEAGIPKGSPPNFSAFGPETADCNWADVSAPDVERHWLWRHYVAYETMWPASLSLFLQRDDLPRFFEALFNNLAAAVHQDFRVGVESLDGVPSCSPGDGERWQILRRMFVHEMGGYDGSRQELFLFQAVPRCWLRPGDQMSVRKMGTYFGGRVDLRLRVADDGNSVLVAARLDLAVAPAHIRLRLRSGDGRPLRSATVNGQTVAVLDRDLIQLPSSTRGHYEIVGSFR